jgi:hypothetical protein
MHKYVGPSSTTSAAAAATTYENYEYNQAIRALRP